MGQKEWTLRFILVQKYMKNMKQRDMKGLTVMNYSYSNTAAMNDMPKRLSTGIITFIVNCGPSI